MADATPTVRKRERVAPPSTADMPEITLDDAPARGEPKSEVQAVLGQFTKLHGPHIMKRADVRSRFIHLPTDVFTLDMGLHGGIPQSLPSMIYGWESSGKSTLAMRLIASAQRKFPDMSACLIDAEGTFDPMWAQRHGIDCERLILAQPEMGEQAIDMARALLGARDVSIVVLDSLPALVPMKEVEKSAEDEVVALQARLIGRFIRVANQSIINERARGHLPSLLMINQWRNKIQMMGDPRSLPGGNALKFFVAVRFEVMNKEILGKDAYDIEVVDYNEHSWKITKNKVGNGIRNGEFTMIRNPDHPFGAGFIDDAKSVLTFARKLGLLTGSGSSWYLDGVNDLSNTKPQRFMKLQEVADHLYSDLEFYEATKRRMIGIQRKHNGLSEDGWF